MLCLAPSAGFASVTTAGFRGRTGSGLIVKRRRLPIGTQTFSKLRERDCYYVDKTAYIEQLWNSGDCYFLSRPRRFGKSLFVDTLKEVFEGNKELFRGLHIHDRWDWSVRHPVVRLSFGSGNFKDPQQVSSSVMLQLDYAWHRCKAALRQAPLHQRFRRFLSGLGRPQFGYRTDSSAADRFWHLLRAMRRAAGCRVVVLVDEYDKPILDALELPEVAKANRDFLRGLYGVVKDCDEDIRFSFITGVSKFSKVSLFSGLNSLRDITLNPHYSAICGYTERDLDEVFAPELPGLDRDRIRRWYNGYNWLGGERVYNPFDILLLFGDRKFKPYWIETGSSKFLIDTLERRGVTALDLERMWVGDAQLSKFDVEDIGTEALLFRTGHLTITEEREVGGKAEYRLHYPNREVRQSLNEGLLERMARDPAKLWRNLRQLREAMEAAERAGLKRVLRQIFINHPYQLHAGSKVGKYEAVYVVVVSTHFLALGFDVTLEESSSVGRTDMVVKHGGRVYVVEFKVDAAKGAALRQIKDKGYAEKHMNAGGPVYLMGLEFSSKTHNVEHLDLERAK